LESNHDETQYSKILKRQLKQVHQNRRVIEGLFSAIVSPSLWSQNRLNRLQVEMFKTEQGLGLLIEATLQLFEHPDKLPGDVLKTLTDGLESLEAKLWAIASGEGQDQLSEIGEWLQS
jgi:phage-related minor tail protein